MSAIEIRIVAISLDVDTPRRVSYTPRRVDTQRNVTSHRISFELNPKEEVKYIFELLGLQCAHGSSLEVD